MSAFDYEAFRTNVHRVYVETGVWPVEARLSPAQYADLRRDAYAARLMQNVTEPIDPMRSQLTLDGVRIVQTAGQPCLITEAAYPPRRWLARALERRGSDLESPGPSWLDAPPLTMFALLEEPQAVCIPGRRANASPAPARYKRQLWGGPPPYDPAETIADAERVDRLRERIAAGHRRDDWGAALPLP